MNNIFGEMLKAYDEDLYNSLQHIGVKRRSGRYPYGSGEVPFQHAKDFLGRVQEMRDSKFTFIDKTTGKTLTGDKAIYTSMGLNSTEFRTQITLANAERANEELAMVVKLKDKGYSNRAIAERMGLAGESSVRSILKRKTTERATVAQATADLIRDKIESVNSNGNRGAVDVSSGVEKELGISKEKLKSAIHMLELEGYQTYTIGLPQVTNPKQRTKVNLIGPPDMEYKEGYDYEHVYPLNEHISYDKGKTFEKAFEYPESLSSKRLAIRYGDEGGRERDGTVEIRRGLDDLSLGESRYAQVRIMVDGTHYIKGMAYYSDDLPDGIDVRFNTNKKSGTPVGDVLKKIKDDPDNPFGSAIKEHGGQYRYVGKDGKEHLGLINKRAEEGDWDSWANKIPSQFLAKQSEKLIKKQLGISIADKQAELAEINSVTNPTIKKHLLKTFSNACDSAAVHLKAAALPRQHYQVILPVPSLKDTEVYAPNFNNGETVALVRFPHGGIFEIPILTVNNRHAEGKKIVGNARDAVGINSTNAGILSGADFDGDTVMVIPCNSDTSKVQIRNKPPLAELKGFDPTDAYGGKPEGTFKQMTEKNKQKEMGKISNLIMDMTIKGATDAELAKAVKHSMVVIDAVKHKLDYKQSEKDNDIALLKKKYQGYIDPDTGEHRGGASTLITRAKSEKRVLKRKGNPIIDPDTGEISYKQVEEQYYDKKAKKWKYRTDTTTQMADTKDARTLSSGYRKEELYADYANAMKAMANNARKQMLATKDIPYNPEAKAKYINEYTELKSRLKIAELNAPKERQAQFIANSIINAKLEDNPQLKDDGDALKKERQRALVNARIQVGAKRHLVDITDRQWEAIQSGAISPNFLKNILDHADIDKLRERATPRTRNEISKTKQTHMKLMFDSGYTISEIANRLNVSTSTINKYLKQ